MEDGWAWIFRSSRESGWWSGGGGVSICNGTIPLPQAGELALETHTVAQTPVRSVISIVLGMMRLYLNEPPSRFELLPPCHFLETQQSK